MIKTREFKESNYRAVWYNGKTIRIALDPYKPITELEYPEFYDVKITGNCYGNCPWCYMDSKESDCHYGNIIEKINSFFGNMDENQRPFQVAIGGGEPTGHPFFIESLRAFRRLGIEPNYTTNGMNADDALGNMTKLLCGGVAVSCHPHLKRYWENASNIFSSYEVRLNFHLIISDKESIDEFSDIYKKWEDKVEYFVLLPYGEQGRAGKKEIDWEYLVKSLPENTSKIAFGANFYPYLMRGNHGIKVSLYEPEILSKFITMEGRGKMYASSFSDVIVKENLFDYSG